MLAAPTSKCSGVVDARRLVSIMKEAGENTAVVLASTWRKASRSDKAQSPPSPKGGGGIRLLLVRAPLGACCHKGTSPAGKHSHLSVVVRECFLPPSLPLSLSLPLSPSLSLPPSLSRYTRCVQSMQRGSSRVALGPGAADQTRNPRSRTIPHVVIQT